MYGGHIDVVLKGFIQNTTIVFTDTTFTNGNANLTGGVASINVNLSSTSEQLLNVVRFIRCIFDNNYSKLSGVVSYIQYDISDNILVIFTESNFTNNSAIKTSTIKAHIDSSYTHRLPFSMGIEKSIIVFEGCQWYHNRPHPNDYEHYHYGNIYSTQIPLYFNGTTIISDSHGPAIMVIDTTVTFAGDVTIKRNNPPSELGGCVYINGQSLINLKEGVKVRFSDSAATFGGAIYSEFSLEENSETRIQKPCVFIYEGNIRNSNVSTWNATVSFHNTEAFFSGNAMYLTNTAVCSLKIIDEMFLHNTSVFTGLRDGDISSPATFINFSSPSIKRYHFQQNIYDNTASFQVMLGQPLQFFATIRDILNRTTTTYLTAKLICSNHKEEMKFNHPAAFALRRKIYSSNVFIKGPEGSNNCSIQLHTVTQTIQFFKMSVKVVNCYAGFVYDKKNQKCSCNSNFISNDAIICDIVNGVVCVKRGYWYGRISGTYILQPTQLSVMKCHKDRVCKDSYCVYPELLTQEDEQCADHRGGPLCLLCNNQSSFTYDALRCTPSNDCRRWNIPLLCLLYIFVLAAIVAVFYGSLRVDFRIGSGYLYGIIYYFTVVKYIVGDNKPLNILINIMGSVVRLNPSPIGYLPICSIEHLTKVQHEFLHYASPFLIFVSLFVIVQLAKRFRCFNLPDRSPENGLCTLILLTFTALNETSLNILQRASLLPTGHSVYIQPNIPYLDPTDHLPYAIVAMLIELTFLIPFTFLLLLAPLLSKCVNFVRIKPILDNFQYCYKDNRRWMAGFYFLGRVMFLVLNLISDMPDIFQAVSIVIFSVFAILQPYKKQHLNYADSLLLLNIIGIEYLHKIRYTVSNASKALLLTTDVLTYILVISATIYAFIVIAGGIFQTLSKRRWKYGVSIKRKMVNFVKNKSGAVQDDEKEPLISEPRRRKFHPNKYRDSIFDTFQEEEKLAPDDIIKGLKNAIRGHMASPPPSSTSVSINNDGDKQ